MSNLSRLEKYTEKHRQEVLLLEAEVNGEYDQIAIYRGFSSSLVQATAFDPDVPILPDNAKILMIDRLIGPYNPRQPQYIQRGLTWESMQPLLAEAGV